MDIAVPPTVWALLGISTTSLIGFPLMKNAKTDPAVGPARNGQSRSWRRSARVPMR